MGVLAKASRIKGEEPQVRNVRKLVTISIVSMAAGVVLVACGSTPGAESRESMTAPTASTPSMVSDPEEEEVSGADERPFPGRDPSTWGPMDFSEKTSGEKMDVYVGQWGITEIGLTGLESTDPNVAEVDESVRRIFVVGAGEAVITATTRDGEKIQWEIEARPYKRQD